MINRAHLNKIGRQHALHVLLTLASQPVLKGCETLLDVGCGDGTKTRKVAQQVGISLDRVIGIEANEHYAKKASQSFKVLIVDIEREPLPLPDGSTDLVICHQVFEHIKNIHLVASEINRVCTGEGGHAIIGIPNLASLHNRLLLLLGHQPTSIKVLSEHVRGFTAPELTGFLRNAGFEPVKVAGAGFYPLTHFWLINFATTLLPSFSVYIYALAQKKRSIGTELIQYFTSLGDTDYVSKS